MDFSLPPAPSRLNFGPSVGMMPVVILKPIPRVNPGQGA